jgi:hypothetical protein
MLDYLILLVGGVMGYGGMASIILDSSTHLVLQFAQAIVGFSMVGIALGNITRKSSKSSKSNKNM